MGLYDEVEIEDMEWSEDLQAFTYSCPCGDLFQITLVRHAAQSTAARRRRCLCKDIFCESRLAYHLQLCSPPLNVHVMKLEFSEEALTGYVCFLHLQKELADGEDIARCPSCSLYVQVIYDQVRCMQGKSQGASSSSKPSFSLHYYLRVLARVRCAAQDDIMTKFGKAPGMESKPPPAIKAA